MMPSTFAITNPETKAKLDANRKGQTVFSVANTSGRPLRATAEIVPGAATAATPVAATAAQPAPAPVASPAAVTGGAASGTGTLAPDAAPKAADKAWFTVAGMGERDFPVDGGTQQYTVQIAVPPAAPAGTYAFQLKVKDKENPDEFCTLSPTVAFEIAAAKAAPKKFPVWVIPVVLGVLVLGVIGVVASRIFGGGGGEDAPVIVNFQAATVPAQGGVVVSFFTDRPSCGTAEYRRSGSGMGEFTTDLAQVTCTPTTSVKKTLDTLTPDTEYEIRGAAIDPGVQNGKAGYSTPATIRTEKADSVAPAVTLRGITAPDKDTAQITFSLDKPGTARVKYGTAANDLRQIAEAVPTTEGVRTFAATLIAVRREAPVFYAIEATNRSGVTAPGQATRFTLVRTLVATFDTVTIKNRHATGGCAPAYTFDWSLARGAAVSAPPTATATAPPPTATLGLAPTPRPLAAATPLPVRMIHPDAIFITFPPFIPITLAPPPMSPTAFIVPFAMTTAPATPPERARTLTLPEDLSRQVMLSVTGRWSGINCANTPATQIQTVLLPASDWNVNTGFALENSDYSAMFRITDKTEVTMG